MKTFLKKKKKTPKDRCELERITNGVAHWSVKIR